MSAWRCIACGGEVAAVRRSPRCACGGELVRVAVETLETSAGEVRLGAALHRGAYAEIVAGTLGTRDVVLKRVRAERVGSPAAMARMEAELETLRAVRGHGLLRAIALLPSAAVLPRYRTTLEAASPREIDALGGVGTIAQVLAGALHTLHAAGIIHRDVHGQNVLVFPSMRPADDVVLADFGHRHRAGRIPVTAPDCVAARPGYAAPELLGSTAAVADERSDVYALGVTLHQVVSGRRPHQHPDSMAESRRTRDESARPLRLWPPRVSVEPALRAWIDAALARDPSRRPRLDELPAQANGPAILEAT